MAENDGKPQPPSLDDFPDYVAAFKASSDRARYAFFIVIIATVLIFITNYNVQLGSWPLRRIDAWFDAVPGDASTTTADGSTPSKIPPFTNGQLRLMREEYLKQFAGRAVFAESPIPGVSIDVNDLGIIGGVALVLLMLVLVVCVVREHENLYLALYKVRMVCDEEGAACSLGQSRANLLYHSLAMSQVLSSPPTLARWQQRGVLHHFGVLFFAPAIVYAWVVFCDVMTRQTGEGYGRSVVSQLIFEACVLAGVVVLSCAAWLHTRAMAKRWRRAFFRVNGRRLLVDQMSLREWLKLGRSRADKRRLDAGLSTMLVDAVETAAPTDEFEVHLSSATQKIAGRSASRGEVRDLTRKIIGEGKKLAKEACANTPDCTQRLLTFEVGTNRIQGKVWTVTGMWKCVRVESDE